MIKYRAGYNLYRDTEEDNIERGRFRATIARQFAKAVAIDRENAAINGDASLPTGDARSLSNNLLGVNDGWSVILQAGVPAAQQIDAAGAGPSRALYMAMKQAIPVRYLGALGSLDEAGDPYVFVVSPSVENLWLEENAGRLTGLGDRSVQGFIPTPYGIPIFMVPLMSESLTYGTALGDCCEIWLTPLKNLILFVQRVITWESEREPRLDRTEYTMWDKAWLPLQNVVENLAICWNALRAEIAKRQYFGLGNQQGRLSAPSETTCRTSYTEGDIVRPFGKPKEASRNDSLAYAFAA